MRVTGEGVPLTFEQRDIRFQQTLFGDGVIMPVVSGSKIAVSAPQDGFDSWLRQFFGGHLVLRSVFEGERQHLQKLADPDWLTVRHVGDDLSVDEALAGLRDQPFPEDQPLRAVAVSGSTGSERWVCYALDHLVADLRSTVILDDLLRAGQFGGTDYHAYAAEQQKGDAARIVAREAAYWLDRIGGKGGPSGLFPARDGASCSDWEIRHVVRDVDARRAGEVLAREGLSSLHVSLAATAHGVERTTGHATTPIFTPQPTRRGAHKTTVGLFVNERPYLVETVPGSPVATAHRCLQQSMQVAGRCRADIGSLVNLEPGLAAPFLDGAGWLVQVHDDGMTLNVLDDADDATAGVDPEAPAVLCLGTYGSDLRRISIRWFLHPGSLEVLARVSVPEGSVGDVQRFLAEVADGWLEIVDALGGPVGESGALT